MKLKRYVNFINENDNLKRSIAGGRKFNIFSLNTIEILLSLDQEDWLKINIFKRETAESMYKSMPDYNLDNKQKIDGDVNLAVDPFTWTGWWNASEKLVTLTVNSVSSTWFVIRLVTAWWDGATSRARAVISWEAYA